MLLDGFEIAALVDTLRLHRAAPQRSLSACLGQTPQRGFGIRHQHAQHAVQVAVVEGVSGALQEIVIGENLLGPGYVARCPLQFDGVGPQIDVDVQPIFQHVQIFVSRAEQGLNVVADINTLLHSVAGAFPPVVWDGHPRPAGPIRRVGSMQTLHSPDA